MAEPTTAAPGQPTTGRKLQQAGVGSVPALLEPVVPAAELAALVTPPVGGAPPGTGRKLQQVSDKGKWGMDARLEVEHWRLKHTLILLLNSSPLPLSLRPHIPTMQAGGEEAPVAAGDQALFAAPLIAPSAEVNSPNHALNRPICAVQ